ncbi:MAG: helix-turn-helix transcriptional regulator [Acidimicrobiales bacterium]
MTEQRRDSWIFTAEYALSDDDQLPAGDRRVEMLDRVLAKEHSGRGARTATGWTGSVRVEADALVHNLEQAALLGKKLVEDANRQVGLPPAALVSQQAMHADVFHAQLETISLSELLGTAEVCETLGITRQRLHQLRQSGRFPEPDRELTATPLWMRSTLKDFTVGWRRIPGPTPRPMDMDGLFATGSMRV